ncbi:MAG: carbohydrate ABC transporter permease, partial [Chloroflexota bacterium]|nr:carbohydrate ABC transporter permease [Chloroflexota bacterium]
MRQWPRLVIYLFLTLFALFYLVPIYLLLITGMKSFAEVNLYKMWDLPAAFSLDSFAKAWFGSDAEGFRGLSGNFWNSVQLAVPATILSALFGSMNGYILSKWKFRGSNTLFMLLLFGMFIPYQSILIPLVQVLQLIGLYGTIPGLIFVHVVYGIPITTLIFRNYYATVPTEMVEAAKIDGANILGIYRYIMFPISLP